MNINDLDHFVLQPGETLILRARRPLPNEQLQRTQEWLDKRKVPAVVIAGPDFDIMAGMLSNLMPDEDMQAHCDAVIDAYDEGRQIWARAVCSLDDSVTAEWFTIHKHANPLPIDFERWEFSITKP